MPENPQIRHLDLRGSTLTRGATHAAHGDWPLKPTLPFIPGHEGIGRVAAVGSGVTIVKEGDRVGVPWLYSACGHCEYCLTAWETVCAQAEFGGYTRNGGFAAEGKVKADIERQPLSAVNQVFERLEQGDVPSRVVLDFATT